jgi:ABC-2 type transport system ATP-binding protein
MYLEFKNVTFAYDEKKVLDDISFAVNRGEITGLIGANGVGKTTAISNVTRKLQPQKGDILLNGQSIYEWNNHVYPVSYIPDKPIFYEELTVMEHLNFVKTLYPQTDMDTSYLIDKFELQEHLYKVPGLLSKGTLQKLMIAIALLRDYELLLADEPLNGLDPRQISIFKNMLKELCSQNKAILISTHLLDMAEEFCDKYIILGRGNVIASGTKKEILRKYHFPADTSLEKIYLFLNERED